MKKFNYRIVLFLLPILLVGFVIELLVRNIPNNFTQKTNNFLGNSKNIETLIIGNSHNLYGINPEYFESNTFNLSNVSQSLDIDYKILKRYDLDLINLKSVILNLSYFSLFENLDKTNENWRLKDYNIYSGLQLNYNPIHQSEVLSVKLKTNLKRIFKYYVKEENLITINDFGWGTDANSSSSIDLEVSGIIAAKRHTIDDEKFLTKNIETLNSLIKFYNNKNVKVVLVTLPAYKSYISNLDLNQLKTIIKNGKRLEQNYNNCNYINLLESDLFEGEDFFDGDHLNEKGAEKLSLLINKLLKH